MKYSFNSIAGYKDEKEELMRICDVLNNRDYYISKGARLPRGIIFYGSTGTGKTLFAKVLSASCNFDTKIIDVTGFNSERDICKKIKDAFKDARNSNRPTIIFFDELDKVLPDESEDFVSDKSKAILMQLLTLIDGMDSRGNIVFVATCNNYYDLPEALRRPGRLDKKIHIALPTLYSRISIVDMYTELTSCDFELTSEEIAQLTAGFSGAALETLVNECVILSDKNNYVDKQTILQKIQEISGEDIARESNSIDDQIQACQNVGKFIVADVLQGGDYLLNLDENTVCNNLLNAVVAENDDYYDSDDYDDSDDDYCDDYDEDYNDDDDCDYDDDGDEEDWDADENYDGAQSYLHSLYSETEMLNAATALLGGYVAHQIVYGQTFDCDRRDLENAEEILRDMTASGMFGLEFRYSYYRHKNVLPYTDEQLARLNKLFLEKLTDCYNVAKEILTKNEQLLVELASALVERRVIRQDECELLIEQVGGIKE